MIINPFVAGVLTTVFAELVLFVGFLVVSYIKTQNKK